MHWIQKSKCNLRDGVAEIVKQILNILQKQTEKTLFLFLNG